MKHLLILPFLFSFTISLFSQASANQSDIHSDMKTDLNFYADVMINALEPQHRKRASIKFSELFESYCNEQSKGLVDLSFNKFISVLSADDGSFEIVTWQVKLENEKHAYKGYLFQEGQPYTKLQSSDNFNSDIEFEAHSANDWYGALYYKMHKFSDTDYLIFGFNAQDEFTKSKIADVLSIKNGSLTLGQEIFQDKEDTLTYNYKIVLDYSSDASVNLNFNPGLDMIVHDHLINRIGRLPNQGPTYLPDGTYEGYSLVDGKWMYKEKLFDHSYGNDNAPTPKPVIDNSKGLKRKKGTKKRSSKG